MSSQVLNDNIKDVVKRYAIDMEPMISIAKHYGVTRQAVFYALKRAGIDTSKEIAGSMYVTCTHCGYPTKRTRSRFRNTVHPFCSKDCYHAWLDRGAKVGNRYEEYRVGRTEARALVSRYIDLLPGYIVHHEDRNQHNNAIANLKVFASSGDHTRYHRGFRVPIIWDGEGVELMKVKPRW